MAWVKILIMVGFLAGAPSPHPLTLSVSPHLQMAPGTITLHTRVTPSPSNSYLCTGVDNLDDGGGMDECKQLDGESAPISSITTFTHLSGGHYVAHAILGRASLPTITVTEEFDVIAP